MGVPSSGSVGVGEDELGEEVGVGDGEGDGLGVVVGAVVEVWIRSA